MAIVAATFTFIILVLTMLMIPRVKVAVACIKMCEQCVGQGGSRYFPSRGRGELLSGRGEGQVLGMVCREKM